jgi:hypothetical protein
MSYDTLKPEDTDVKCLKEKLKDCIKEMDELRTERGILFSIVFKGFPVVHSTGEAILTHDLVKRLDREEVEYIEFILSESLKRDVFLRKR